MMKKAQEYVSIVQPHLSQSRFEHSCNVSETAEKLAKLYGANPEKAAVAGILHDIMKDTPYDEQLKMLKRFGIILTDVEQNAPKLYHAISGASYIKNVLNISDTDILQAVRYHTTARANMSVLEEVVFVADFISADRCYQGVEKLRKKAEKSLSLAMREGLEFTIKELVGIEKPIHPDTVAAYNWVLLSSEKKVKK